MGRARNVILMIGDGMGDSEISAARDYEVGPRGRLSMDSLPATASITVSAVHEDNPRLPVYVADSAASGTAWATGQKTSNGRISTSAQTDRDLPTLLEIVQRSGRRTGSVTTAELTDATPAVLASHADGRVQQLTTRDGAPLTLSHATNVPGRAQEHTGTEVRAVAYGPGSAAVHGTLDQTDLFGLVLAAIGASDR